ncbi:MAG TPA: Rv2175c family DNA-binding protein [Nocardioidaceae bacterium]|nr:Rv2175c family DNA-binding protein [Nocardioidaceae bacterium]
MNAEHRQPATDQPPALDSVVTGWLSLREAADLLGISPNGVRQLMRESQLLAVRHGDVREPEVPADFLLDGEPVKGLAGTITVLSDAGYDPEASVRWLFTEDATLPGSPIQALRENRGTEVRRRAQALAF